MQRSGKGCQVAANPWQPCLTDYRTAVLARPRCYLRLVRAGAEDDDTAPLASIAAAVTTGSGKSGRLDVLVSTSTACDLSWAILDPGGLFAGYAARLSSRRARWLVRARSSGFPFQ